MIGRCGRVVLIHEHHFEQHLPKPGEVRTRWVVALTALTMLVEVAAGIAFGSMALLADGLHMASHAAALGLSALAYAFARRHAHDRSFSFGTGKVNSLAGFASAVVLAIFAVMMAIESVGRFLEPVPIAFDQAIVVAALGLVVNGVSVFILGGRSHHHDGGGPGDHGHHDHTLRAAHLHVLADALTSLLAIVALLAAKYAGAVWMDPAMGIVGGLLVARWSWGLLTSTSRVLLDKQAPEAVVERLRRSVESGAARVIDLHVWEIGPGYRAAIVSLEADGAPCPADVEASIPHDLKIAHLTVEVHGRDGRGGPGGNGGNGA